MVYVDAAQVVSTMDQSDQVSPGANCKITPTSCQVVQTEVVGTETPVVECTLPSSGSADVAVRVERDPVALATDSQSIPAGRMNRHADGDASSGCVKPGDVAEALVAVERLSKRAVPDQAPTSAS